jgi:hypothetical protein
MPDGLLRYTLNWDLKCLETKKIDLRPVRERQLGQQRRCLINFKVFSLLSVLVHSIVVISLI